MPGDALLYSRAYKRELRRARTNVSSYRFVMHPLRALSRSEDAYGLVPIPAN